MSANSHAESGAQPGKVLVIQNSKGSGPGRLVDWWAEDGLDLHILEAFDGVELPASLEGYDALVMLGGGLMPDADETAPWLPAERALTREAIAGNTPLLGICLGGQLLAHVAGGEVRAKHGLPESGSTPLTVRPEASDDPLMHDLPDVVPAMEHRVDAITALPPDARWLLQSERCPNQAFRVKDSRAWGLQFHPEITADRVRRWKPEDLKEQGYDPDEVARQAEADEPISTPIWREIARRFSALAHESASTREAA